VRKNGKKVAKAVRKSSQTAARKGAVKRSAAKAGRKSVKKAAAKAGGKVVRKPGKAAAKKTAVRRSGPKRAAAKKRAPRRSAAGRVVLPLPGGKRFTCRSELPLLPLRDIVVFPGMMAPLLVGRPASVAAVERAVADDKIFAAFAQRDAQLTEPETKDLHSVGTIVRAVQVLKVPDGTLKILVEGICRVTMEEVAWRDDHRAARVALAERPTRPSSELKALLRRVVEEFREYVTLNRRIPDEIGAAIESIPEPHNVANVVAGHLIVDLSVRQRILASLDLKTQLSTLSRVIGEELEILRIDQKIEGEVRHRVTKGQREFYLQEQLKAIRKELGESLGEEDHDGAELREAVEKAGMPTEVRKKTLTEVDRLKRMSPMSPEATVVRGYVETLVSLPWKKRTRDRLDLDRAQAILDEDHYGLVKVKERILEYLAIVKLVKRPRGSILCLVGPPGVGKTSLGRSIARALGRKFVRVSLGGVRDEAEIRGHRRTYIGSMPGRIIQGIRKAGTKNPVFLLDEVDKLASDFRGDPSAALLEVLDPEQNSTFNDHYLDCDFDLSEVLFLTTANVLPAIPPALRDRMEVLRLPGYLKHEKMGIARQFLVPKQITQHGLSPKHVTISEKALRLLITRYTREAGVRNLEREIATLCRKVARGWVKGREKRVQVGVKAVEKSLGPPRFPERRVPKENQVGVASGLAWTEYGGDVLPVEVMILPGSGKISLTGRLGEVMRESARTALSYAKSRASLLGLSTDFADRLDLHVHMPEGAIPKDGPSAGVCIATAVLSALIRAPVRREVAMTGEITLLGTVLPIGGLNEKVVAASLAGYTHVIVPGENEPDWEEIPKEAKRGLTVTFASHVDEVLRTALVPSKALDRLFRDAERGPSVEGLPGIAH
jgi:ATP-dependent Lon protease